MPTVLRVGRFRFFFFSNETQEPAHIHVKVGDDEAKFWLVPVRLAANYGFNGRELNRIRVQFRIIGTNSWRRGMSTSARKAKGPTKSNKRKPERAYVPTTALAKSVEFDEVMMRVFFTDGRVLSVPLVWFPVLR